MEETLIGESSRGFDVSEWGTFKDSLKAPVHGWFTYPAGFSYKAVEHSLSLEKLEIGVSRVYDPFMGSGTTNLTCKAQGFNSVGIEAHPFVYRIARTKINWDIEYTEIHTILSEIEKKINSKASLKQKEALRLESKFPELVLKCYLPETLKELYLIRENIKLTNAPDYIQRFLELSLISTLRDVSIAQTGWPYIAPGKLKVTSKSKQGFETFKNRALKMTKDIDRIKSSSINVRTDHHVILGDSRERNNSILSESIDHIFTSPPYLNNFDYADRTRLEMYFMGDAKNWSDITSSVRNKLITSATTQISRTDEKYNFLNDFVNDCPEVFSQLSEKVLELNALRLVRGGKKSYDLLTVGYFNDMYLVLKECARVLKNGKKAIFILGDSAPYGVHIATDVLIGEIGKQVGFSEYKIDVLRSRGGKWAKNPQRHSHPLRESIVTLYK